MRILIALLVASAAFAQTAAEPEIRGTVQESVSNVPVAAANVVLKEFVPVENFITPKVIATTLTNARGEFSFKPGHMGDFYIETTKAGYDDAALQSGAPPSAEVPLQLTQQNPSGVVRLQLLRPGEITGRVVDPAGEPIENVRITLESPGQRGIGLRTDVEGKFHITVVPGSYVIQTASRTEAINVRPDGPGLDYWRWFPYSDEAFKVVDEEYESLYWPGGVSNPDAALPLQVAPGGVGNLGTIVLRKVSAYRARISIEGECRDNENWRNSFTPLTRAGNIQSFSPGFQCGRDLLLRGLQPGKYVFTTWSDQHWAQTELAIIDRNITAKLTTVPAAHIEGRVIIPEGVQIASLGAIHILTDPGRVILANKAPGADVDRDGKFLLKNVLWPSHSIQVLVQNPDFYVKQIRYGGLVLPGNTLTVAPGAPLEVHLDNNAASITGTVKDSGVAARSIIYLARWPLTEPVLLEKWISTSEDGEFKLTGLAPGEYRLAALARSGENVPPQDTLRQFLPKGMPIKLERGEQKTIEVKLMEP